MAGNFPPAMASQTQTNATNCVAQVYGDRQCPTCWQQCPLHCPGFQSIGSVSVATWPIAALTVADVERIVAKALEEHDKKYLAIIEKLADALAGKK